MATAIESRAAAKAVRSANRATRDRKKADLDVAHKADAAFDVAKAAADDTAVRLVVAKAQNGGRFEAFFPIEKVGISSSIQAQVAGEAEGLIALLKADRYRVGSSSVITIRGRSLLTLHVEW